MTYISLLKMSYWWFGEEETGKQGGWKHQAEGALVRAGTGWLV